MSVDYPDDVAAIVYDLDGTLLRLEVDWDDVLADLRAIYRDEGIHFSDAEGVWELLERAHQNGLAADVEAAIADHERAGARTSVRLGLADDVTTRSVPVGICSLNCEDACRIGLEKHDLEPHVDAVVGRDTVGARKPDPKPLLAAVDVLDVVPAETLFVGDSASDEKTADRAGTRFAYVGDGPTFR